MTHFNVMNRKTIFTRFGRVLAVTTALLSTLTPPFTTARALPPTLPFECPATTAADAQVPIMIDIDSAYAYWKPDWKSAQVGRVVKWQCLTAVGRNDNAEWTLVTYGNGQAWLHGSAFQALADLRTLPVTSQTQPSDLSLLKAPGASQISPQMKALYKAAAKLGRNPRLFTTAGECNSEPPLYTERYASGAVQLAQNKQLAIVATKFGASFNRASMATLGGYNTASMLDALWSDPKKCNSNEGPLACELRTSKASVIFISLGTGDQTSWQDFELRYRQLIAVALKNNTVPVLVTKADALETEEKGAPPDHINSVIRKLAAEFGVPLMDLAAAVQDLPGQGLADAKPPRFHASAEAMDMRILMTLQILMELSAG